MTKLNIDNIDRYILYSWELKDYSKVTEFGEELTKKFFDYFELLTFKKDYIRTEDTNERESIEKILMKLI